MGTVVQFKDATIGYQLLQWKWKFWLPYPGRRHIVVFKNLSWSLEGGERVLLLGANGSGKSTLLRAVAGLLRPSCGSVLVTAARSYGFGSAVVLISDRTSSFWPDLSVEWNLRIWACLCGIPKRHGRELIEYVSTMFELNDIWSQPIMSLSSGQYQRFTIAAQFLSHPQVVLMDEPWRSVDTAMRRTLLAKVSQYILEKKHRTLIVSTHQVDRHMLSFFDRIIRVEGGELVETSYAKNRLRKTVSKTDDRWRQAGERR